MKTRPQRRRERDHLMDNLDNLFQSRLYLSLFLFNYAFLKLKSFKCDDQLFDQIRVQDYLEKKYLLVLFFSNIYLTCIQIERSCLYLDSLYVCISDKCLVCLSRHLCLMISIVCDRDSPMRIKISTRRSFCSSLGDVIPVYLD